MEWLVKELQGCHDHGRCEHQGCSDGPPSRIDNNTL